MHTLAAQLSRTTLRSAVSETDLHVNASEDRSFGLLGLALFGTVLCGGAVFWMAHFVGRGGTAAWAPWQQGAWFLGMLLLLSVGGKSILRVFGGDERWAWMPFLALGTLLTIGLIAWPLQAFFGIHWLATFLGASACLVGWGTWRRPWWFWNDWRAGLLRGLIGDNAARFVYGVVALLLALLAVLAAVQLRRAA